MPAILRLDFFDGWQGHRVLAARACQHAPHDAADRALRVIDLENREDESLSILQKLPKQWEQPLAEALLTRAKRGHLKPQCMLQILSALLERKVPGAVELTRSLVPSKIPKRVNRRVVALFAARFLMEDWVKAHLEDDLKQRGVVVGREVRIHRQERTDIHVDAVTRDERNEVFDSVKVIIEVKGCWHKELKTAMQTQLVERYLANNDCRHGLYLVGWFQPGQWDKRDPRRKRVGVRPSKELERYLIEQAKTLSNGERRIQVVVLDASMAASKKEKIRRPGARSVRNRKRSRTARTTPAL